MSAETTIPVIPVMGLYLRDIETKQVGEKGDKSFLPTFITSSNEVILPHTFKV